MTSVAALLSVSNMHMPRHEQAPCTCKRQLPGLPSLQGRCRSLRDPQTLVLLIQRLHCTLQVSMHLRGMMLHTSGQCWHPGALTQLEPGVTVMSTVPWEFP